MDEPENSPPPLGLPPVSALSLLPLKTQNALLHLLIAAVTGFCSAIPVILIVWIAGVEACTGAPVLFAAFLAILIRHALSRFAFPDYLEKHLSYGVASLLLTGQVVAAYLFFLNTAFYGSTAFVAAVLILIPVCGSLAMIWQLRCPTAWGYTLLLLYAGLLMFSWFSPTLLCVPFEEFLSKAAFSFLPQESIRNVWLFLLIPSLFLILTILGCRYSLNHMKDHLCAAILSGQITELAVWFGFLLASQKLNVLF